jgi:hypothetical protein
MKTLLTISILPFLSLISARADEAAVITLKHKSSFTLEASGRNPFWPIGWKPLAKISKAENGGTEIQPAAFLVSSITLDKGARFAIINGKTLAEGQQFGFQLGTQTYQLTVKAIEDGQVILARRDQEIIVPLRRK